jgi:hypothetical protein
MAPKTSAKFKTNTKKGSVKKISVPVVTFAKLWTAYPSSAPVHPNPLTKKDLYANHCAIKVGEALLNAGVSLKSFTGGKCQSCPRLDKKRHPLVAQELANWLNKKPFPGCPAPLKSDGGHYTDDFNDKRGIIFFKDYWVRDGEKGRTGDHIDLWNDQELASLGFWVSLARVDLGISWDGWISAYSKSKQVLLWEIK